MLEWLSWEATKMAENPGRVKWVIVGSVIGTVVGVAITPLIKHLITHLYERVGIKVSGPRTRVIRRR